MKKNLVAITLFIAIIAVIIPSCKKKTTDPTPTPVVTPANVICDGNGSTDYYPLVLNNTWHYKDSGSNAFDNTVTGTVTYGSFTYFVVANTLGGTMYLRKASSGDIMAYNSSTSSEVLFIPASPTTGQTWAYTLEFAATRKVISTSTSFSTSSCSYTGCLKIQLFNASGVGKDVIYYKKGVGMISTDQIWQGIIVTNLNTLTLH